MDSQYGNGISKDISAKAESLLNGDPFPPVMLLGNFDNEEQCGKDSDSASEGVTTDRTEISKSPKSAASSSSESDSISAEDFKFGPIVFPNSKNNVPKSSPKSKENVTLHRKEVIDVSIAALLSFEKIYGSGPISPVSDTPQSLPSPTLSQTHSPPVQIMERSEGYDPDRIPASAFISGSSTPTDWSANSNDSLFSIPIGHSLAREQFTGAESSKFQDFTITEESQKWKEPYKSGELSRSKELQSFGVIKISNQVKFLGETSPVAKEKEDKPKGLDLRKNRGPITEQLNYRNINTEDKANQEGHKNKNTIVHCDDNRTKNQSSTPPINRKPSQKRCCLCSSNCSWDRCPRRPCTWGCCPKRPCSWDCCKCSSNCTSSCCSKRPCWSCKWSCSPCFCCKWPSWSACSFKCCSPDCSSWKNTKKLLCCCSCKGLKDWRRRKRCSCPCCCPCSCCSCCSSCAYSCC